ncbi:hypothetical protein C5167_046436 [Papaver somniferum]|uniref:Uncharacterized protein n=2 Tax=Papaver somniferum TaxID=3469 RepID=A0A4Y7LG19_PAPSO|nr:hypothetical protein C5167_046436 [Papaver somniferum]
MLVGLGGKRIAQQTNFEKLDWFAGELILEHQRRSSRIAPTVASKLPLLELKENAGGEKIRENYGVGKTSAFALQED